jgi:hypothetical protein
MLREWLRPIEPGEYQPPSDGSAALGTFAESLLLSYLLQGSTTGAAGSELASGSGITRATGAFSSVAAGTFVNTNAATFGPVNAAGTFSGIQVWNTLPASYTANAGSLLVFGSLQTPRTLQSGDSLVLSSAAMSITLS